MEDAVQRTRRIIAVLENTISQAHSKDDEQVLALAKLNEFNQRHAEAIRLYGSIDSSSKLHAEAKVRLSVTLLKSGNTEQGLEVAASLTDKELARTFSSLTAGEPISGYTIMGDAQTSSGLLDKALDSYEKALHLQANDSHAAAQAAKICLLKGDIARARGFGSQIQLGERYDAIKHAVDAFSGGTTLPNLRYGVGILRGGNDYA